jgi:hypothetical protein
MTEPAAPPAKTPLLVIAGHPITFSPIWILVILLGLYIGFDKGFIPNPWHIPTPGPGPAPGPVVPAFDAQAQAREHAKVLLPAAGAGYHLAASKIRAGARLADALAAGTDSRRQAERADFDARYKAAITAIVAEGKELETPAQVAAAAQLLDDIGTGMAGK